MDGDEKVNISFGAVGFLLITSVLNQTSGFISVIWLMFLGQWYLLLLWLVSLVAMKFVVSFFYLPFYIFLPTLGKLNATSLKRKIIFFFSNAVAQLATIFVPSGIFWFILIYYYNLNEDLSIIPFILLAYSIVTSEFNEMAAKELAADPNSHAPITAVTIQWGSVGLALVAFISNPIPSLTTLLIVQTFVILLGLFLQFKYRKFVLDLNKLYLRHHHGENLKFKTSTK